MDSNSKHCLTLYTRPSHTIVKANVIRKITRKLAVFIAAGNVANRLSENEEFRDLVKELGTLYLDAQPLTKR